MKITMPELTEEVACNDSWAECANWRMWLWRRYRPWFRWMGLAGQANGLMLICGYFPLWLLAEMRLFGWSSTPRDYIYLTISLAIGCAVTAASLIYLRRGWRSREINLEALVGLIFAGGATGLSLLAYAWHFGLL